MTELEKTSIILPGYKNKGNTRVGTAKVRAALPKPIAVRHIRLHNEGESIMKKMEQTLIEPEKFYTIANGNGKVLEVKDYNPDNGAAVQLWDYTGEEWQQWSFVRAGQGVYRICNRFTGKMLDLVACGTTDGTWLQREPIGLYFARRWYSEELYSLTFVLQALKKLKQYNERTETI